MVSVGFLSSSSYTVLVNQQCWRRISSPRHVLLRQVRSIVEDGFRALKLGFWWINLKAIGVAMDFPVANVRFETTMRVLNGDGT
jgi:hypothetical protein